MEKTIKIVEVGPRDGLQNEPVILSTDLKLQLIQKLIACGLKYIEVTSFVSPQWVPSLADHETIVEQLPAIADVHYSVLVPNQQGLQNAIRCHVKEIAVFAAASNTFSQKNINRTIEQSLKEYQSIITLAKQAHLRVRGYVSCVLGCPYEGNVPLSQVVKVAQSLYESGCDEISLGDTIGVGTPFATQKLISEVSQVVPLSQLAVHFHDTYGQALANIVASIEKGITIIDSSVAGLGGCPYAKGASGNVATEDVIYMLEGMGMPTGIDLTLLAHTGKWISEILGHPTRSKAAIAILAQ